MNESAGRVSPLTHLRFCLRPCRARVQEQYQQPVTLAYRASTFFQSMMSKRALM